MYEWIGYRIAYHVTSCAKHSEGFLAHRRSKEDAKNKVRHCGSLRRYFFRVVDTSIHPTMAFVSLEWPLCNESVTIGTDKKVWPQGKKVLAF